MNESLKNIDIDIFLIEIMNKFMLKKKIFKLDNDNILLKDSEEIPRINGDTCNQIIQEILRDMGYTETLTRKDLLRLIVLIEDKLSFESIILYMGYFLDNIKVWKSTDRDNLNREIINKFYTNDYEFFFTTLNETFKSKYTNLKFREDNYTINLFHYIFKDLEKMLRFFIDIPLIPGTEVLIKKNQEFLDDDINYQHIYKIGTISTDFLLEHCNKFKNEIYWFDSPFKNGDLVIFKKEIEFGDEPNSIKIQIGEKARIFSYKPISKSNTNKSYGLYYKMNKEPWDYVELVMSEEELLNKELYDVEKITQSCHNANDEIVKTIQKNEDLFNKLNSQTAGSGKKKMSRMKAYFKDKQKSKKCPKHYYNEPDSENLNDDKEKDINKLRHGWNSKKYKDKYYYVNESMCRRKKQMRDQPLFDEFVKLIDIDNFNSKYLYRPRESFLDEDSYFVYNLANHESSVLNLNMYDVEVDRIQSIKTNDTKLNKLWFYDYELYPIRIPSNPEYNKNEVYDDDDDDDYGSKYYPIIRSNFSFEKLKCDDNLVIFQNTKHKHISTEFIHTCIPILWLYKIFDNFYSIHDKDERYEELKTNIFDKNLMKELLICLKRYIILENRFDNETLSFFIILGALQFITNNISQSKMKPKVKETKYYKQKEQPKFSIFDRYYKLNYIIHDEMKSLSRNYIKILIKEIPFIFKKIIPFWMEKKIEYEQKAINDYSINWTQVILAALQLNQQLVIPIIRHKYPDIFPSAEEKKISNADAIIDKLERRADASLRGPLSPFYNEFKDEFFPKKYILNEIFDNNQGFYSVEDLKATQADQGFATDDSDIIFFNGKYFVNNNPIANIDSTSPTAPSVLNPPQSNIFEGLSDNQKKIIDNITDAKMKDVQNKCKEPNVKCIMVIHQHGVQIGPKGLVIDGHSPVFFSNNQIGAILMEFRGNDHLLQAHDFSDSLAANSSRAQVVPNLLLQPDQEKDYQHMGIFVIVVNITTNENKEIIQLITNEELNNLATQDKIPNKLFTFKYLLDVKDAIAQRIDPGYTMPTFVPACLGFNSKQSSILEDRVIDLLKINGIDERPANFETLKLNRLFWTDFRAKSSKGSKNKLIRANQSECSEQICKIGDLVTMDAPLKALDRLSGAWSIPEKMGTGTINVHITSYIYWQKMMKVSSTLSVLPIETQVYILLNLDTVIRPKRQNYKQRISKAEVTIDGKKEEFWGRSTRGDNPNKPAVNPVIRDKFRLRDNSKIQWKIGEPIKTAPTFRNPGTLPFFIEPQIAKYIAKYIDDVQSKVKIKSGGSEKKSFFETKVSADSSLIDLELFFDDYTKSDDLMNNYELLKSDLDILLININKLRDQFDKIPIIDKYKELFIIYASRFFKEILYKQIINKMLEYLEKITEIKSEILRITLMNTEIETHSGVVDWNLYYEFNNMNKEEFENKYKLNDDISNKIIKLSWSKYIILNNILLNNIDTNYEYIINQIEKIDKVKGRPIFKDNQGNIYTLDLTLLHNENTDESIDKKEDETDDTKEDETDDKKEDETDDKKEDDAKYIYSTDSLNYKIYNYEKLKNENGLQYLQIIIEKRKDYNNNLDILLELCEKNNKELIILCDNVQKLFEITINLRDLFYHLTKDTINTTIDFFNNIYNTLTIPREIYLKFSQHSSKEINDIMKHTNIIINLTECTQSLQDVKNKIHYTKINKTLFNDIRELHNIDMIKSKTKLEKDIERIKIELAEKEEKKESKCSIQ
jgi:hypothetical protein